MRSGARTGTRGIRLIDLACIELASRENARDTVRDIDRDIDRDIVLEILPPGRPAS